MDQLQQIQQELAQVKIKAYDLYQQNEQQVQYIRMLEQGMFTIATRLGIDPNNLQLDAVYAALDKLSASGADLAPLAE